MNIRIEYIFYTEFQVTEEQYKDEEYLSKLVDQNQPDIEMFYGGHEIEIID